MTTTVVVIPMYVYSAPVVVTECDERYFYVDATNGDDGHDGLSEENAWKTISKVNGESFVAGDHICFKRGETWRERLTIPSSGSAGNPIVITDYGSGDLPKLLGSITKNSTGDWTNESGNIWYASSPTWHIHNLIYDNEASYSTCVATKVELTEQGQLWWDDATNRAYVYSVGNPATFYNNVIEGAQFLGGATTQGVVSIYEKNYITVENIDIRYCSSYGVNSWDSSHIKVDGCTIKYIGYNLAETSGYGIYHKHTTINAGTDYTMSNNVISYVNRATEIVAYDGTVALFDVDGNTVSYCILGTIGCGISFGSPTSTDVIDYSGSYVRNNDVSEFVSAGIQMSHSSHVTIEHNVCRDNYNDSLLGSANGIALGTYGMHGHIVRYNHVYNVNGDPSDWNSGTGIFVRNAYSSQIYYNIIHDCVKGIYSPRKDTTGGNDNLEIYNNVVYNCSKYGIWIQGVNAGISTKVITVQNNICDSDDGSGDYDLIFESDTSYDDINCTGGYNCLINDASVYKQADTTYSNSEHDLYATNPLFINGGGSFTLDTDFKIPTDSPCKNTGLDVGLSEDYFGGSVPQGASPDIGAHEYV